MQHTVIHKKCWGYPAMLIISAIFTLISEKQSFTYKHMRVESLQGQLSCTVDEELGYQAITTFHSRKQFTSKHIRVNSL